LGLVALVAASVGGVAPPAEAATGDVTVLGASTPSLFPTGGLVEGPDGHLWFANQNANLGELDPATNQITLHPITTSSYLYDVTVGGDGNIWFTIPTDGLGKVGRYNPTTDTYTLFSVGSSLTFPGKITTAADGTLWVLAGGPGAGRVNLNGTFGPVASGIGSAGDIIAGPDGNIWVTKANSGDAMLRIDPATGASVAFPFDSNGGVTEPNPRQMTIGPDDNIWFSYGNGPGGRGGIGRYVIATDTFTYFNNATIEENNKGLTFGPDGNLWYLRGNVTGSQANQIVRMTTTGSRTSFGATGYPTGPAPQEIVFGPADDLWAGGNNRIGRIDAGAAVDPACLPPAFTDVSTSHPFFNDICWMDQEGISTGYQPGPTYKPSAAVTRSAMSAFMYRLAGSPAFADPANPTFGDVATNNTFYTEIEWMASEGITTGTPASPKPLYKPGSPVSRGAMSAFMYRLAGSPTFSPPAPNATTFGDVNANHPFYEEIEWMADEEITTGTAASPKPLYKPAANVSRGAMSAFMHRLSPLLPS
jgi:streptogramin lyase